MPLRIATKLGFPLLVFWFSTSCAVAPLYQSTVGADRSSVYFTSPNHQDEFLSIDRLALLIYSADANCQMTRQGRVPRVSKIASSKPIQVPSDERLYLRIWAYNSDPLSQVSKTRSAYLSFVPAKNKTYEVRHLDNPKSVRVEVHELMGSDSVGVVEVQTWRSCTVAS